MWCVFTLMLFMLIAVGWFLPLHLAQVDPERVFHGLGNFPGLQGKGGRRKSGAPCAARVETQIAPRFLASEVLRIFLGSLGEVLPCLDLFADRLQFLLRLLLLLRCRVLV